MAQWVPDRNFQRNVNTTFYAWWGVLSNTLEKKMVVIKYIYILLGLLKVKEKVFSWQYMSVVTFLKAVSPCQSEVFKNVSYLCLPVEV